MKDPHYLSFTTSRTARMAILGTPSKNIKTVWIVFHGYRQLAWYFVKKFSLVADRQTLIVAPEGLSKFYLEGHQRVGASWMTKEDRLNEIADQQVYLNQCLRQIEDLLPEQKIKLVLLGFSQGAATAWRWVLHQNLTIDAFIIWASKPPEEYSEAMDQILSEIPMFFIYGKKDQFISPEDAQQLIDSLTLRYPHLQAMSFDGTHKIDSQILTEIKKELTLKLAPSSSYP